MSNFRRRLMCVQQHGGLPAGYQEVEYLESTGTQHINTEVKTKQSLKIECIFSGNQVSTLLFGARKTASLDGLAWGFNNTGYAFSGFGGSTQQNNTTVNTVDGKKHTVVLSNEVYTIDDVNQSLPNRGTFSDFYDIYLFTWNNANVVDTRKFKGKVYNFKIYDNNVLIRDMIPVLDKNNIACMYDTVSKQTFYNQGTGEFRYPIDEKYTPVEYLESTGTQYIDLGIKGNQDSRIDLKIQPTSVQAKAAIFGHFGGNYSSYYLYSSGSDKLFQVGYKNFSDSNVAIETIIYNISNEKNIFNINEYEYSLPSITGNFETGSNLLLFNISGGNYTGLPMKLYSFKLYNNTDLIRDCIPVIDSSGRPCLYDKVEDKFYYNEGSGEFLYE